MSIWQNREIKKLVNEKFQISLLEGNTPLEKLKLENNLNIFLKREDRNPTGSWKDRGVAFKVSKLKEKNSKEAVISSSGNAAISFIKYAELYTDLKLHIVVSESSINPKKLEILKHLTDGTKHEIHLSQFAKTKRAQLAAKGIENLSSSTDSDVLKGYYSLGFELATQIKKSKVPAIFAPCSSGAAVVGMVQGLSMRLEISEIPKIFVCQTSQVHPVVNELYNNIESEDKNLADSITDRSMLRLPQIIKIIQETNGDAFSISNTELIKLDTELNSNLKESLSYTSLLSIAGLLQAKEKYPNTDFSNSICIASGR